MFPTAPPRETLRLRFEGNKINCFPRDHSSRSSQSIKIGIDLSTNKSMKIGISETKIVIQQLLVNQSATQPFLVSSRNARGEERCVTTLKTAVQQTISKLARSKGDRSKAGKGIAPKSHEIFLDVCMLGNEEGRRVKLTENLNVSRGGAVGNIEIRGNLEELL